MGNGHLSARSAAAGRAHQRVHTCRLWPGSLENTSTPHLENTSTPATVGTCPSQRRTYQARQQRQQVALAGGDALGWRREGGMHCPKGGAGASHCSTATQNRSCQTLAERKRADSMVVCCVRVHACRPCCRSTAAPTWAVLWVEDGGIQRPVSMLGPLQLAQHVCRQPREQKHREHVWHIDPEVAAEGWEQPGRSGRATPRHKRVNSTVKNSSRSRWVVRPGF